MKKSSQVLRRTDLEPVALLQEPLALGTVASLERLVGHQVELVLPLLHELLPPQRTAQHGVSGHRVLPLPSTLDGVSVTLSAHAHRNSQQHAHHRRGLHLCRGAVLLYGHLSHSSVGGPGLSPALGLPLRRAPRRRAILPRRLRVKRALACILHGRCELPQVLRPL